MHSTISPGAERANITGDLNISIRAIMDKAVFPRTAGYSASGIVTAVGEGVTHIAPGDRVVVFLGAHTAARPDHESYPAHFTHRDDILTVLKLCAAKRIDTKRMTACSTPRQNAFDGLIYDKSFPIVVQFDWRML